MATSPARVQCLIALGSNIERERYLPEAVRLLRRHPDIDVRNVSRVYESPAAGGRNGAPDFHNAAALVRTALGPRQLRAELKAIEAQLGRVRTDDRDAPRTIDLDIAYYDGLVAEFEGWSIPGRDAATAAHIAIPVAEAAPSWQHPTLGLTMSELAEQLGASDGEVRAVTSIQLSSPYTLRGLDDADDFDEVYAPQLESLVRQQLVELGEDPTRKGLERTPLRVAKALDFLTSGYSSSVAEVVNGAIFDAEGAEEMVTVKDIEFYSTCEHHMLPFFGQASVAYLPKGKIIGLSKVARIIDVFARRLQVQERLTNQIADAIEETLEPHGVAVVIKGRHLCMMMRGVQKQDSSMVTSAMRGTFKDNARTRNEFLDIIGS